MNPVQTLMLNAKHASDEHARLASAHDNVAAILSDLAGGRITRSQAKVALANRKAKANYDETKAVYQAAIDAIQNIG